MTIILLATNARLILENLLKYGVLTNPAHWIFFLVPDGELSAGGCKDDSLELSSSCIFSYSLLLTLA